MTTAAPEPITLRAWGGLEVATGHGTADRIAPGVTVYEVEWDEPRSAWEWECSLDRVAQWPLVDQVDAGRGGDPLQLVSLKVRLAAGEDVPTIVLTFHPEGSRDPQAARTLSYRLGEPLMEGVQPGVGDVEAQVVDEQSGHEGPPGGSESSVGGTPEGTPRAGRAAPSRPGSVRGGAR